MLELYRTYVQKKHEKGRLRMNKALEEKITILAKERCSVLLNKPQNSSFDQSSFIAGYLNHIADNLIYEKLIKKPG
jgi:hypothetical protein